jgi:hypothetical protein
MIVCDRIETDWYDRMATSAIVAPKQDLHSLLQQASVEQDSEKLRDLTDEILAAFNRGESVRFADS